MSDVNNCKIFKIGISTLKETSKDCHDGTDQYMTESQLKVIDFDAVKDEYIRELKLVEVPKSNDALYIRDSNELVFIEFKNGTVSNKIKYNLWLKIFDSLLILMDIIERTANFTRGNLSYILVYNEERNPVEERGSGYNDKVSVQDSDSRTKIAKTLIEKKAKGNFIRFGLERFEKLYFKKVYTYTQEEFEDNFVSQHVV